MRKHNHFVMLYFSKTQISVCGDVDDAVELKCEKKGHKSPFLIKL